MKKCFIIDISLLSSGGRSKLKQIVKEKRDVRFIDKTLTKKNKLIFAKLFDNL